MESSESELAQNILELTKVVGSLDLKLDQAIEKTIIRLLSAFLPKQAMSLEEIISLIREAVDKDGLEGVSSKSGLTKEQIQSILSGTIPESSAFTLARYLKTSASNIPFEPESTQRDNSNSINGHLV